MTKYCQNLVCEWEAITSRSRGRKNIHLCHQCATAWDMALVEQPKNPLLKPMWKVITNIPDCDITKHRERLAEINGIARAALKEVA